MSLLARYPTALAVAALAGAACSSGPVQPYAEPPDVTEWQSPIEETVVATSIVKPPAILAEMPGSSDGATTRIPARGVQLSAAPTSTWVAFEETEPRWAVLESVRVAQADSDRKGPVLWWPRLPLTSLSEEKGSTLDEYTANAFTIDLCGVLAKGPEGHLPSPDSDVEYYRQMYERAEQASCPDDGVEGDVVSCTVIKPGGIRESCPWPEPIVEGEGRWMVDDVCSPAVHGSVRPTRLDALRAAERGRVRNLPFWADLLGYWVETDALGCRGVAFPDPAAPVDEVSVLAETVALDGGTLRGLVRNHSRTLWAWDVRVFAAGRVYRWPLTIQPGETAPFEFSGWNGPVDPAAIELAVAAEMSNDADLSRGFEMRVYPSPHFYWSCPQDRAHFKDLAPEVWEVFPSEAGCMRRLTAQGGLRGNGDSHNPKAGAVSSHPSMHGRLVRGLIEDLRAYVALLDSDGRVLEVRRLTPYNDESYAVDVSGGRIYDRDGEAMWLWPTITREYPPQSDRGHGIVLLFPDPEPYSPVIWIGGANHSGA